MANADTQQHSTLFTRQRSSVSFACRSDRKTRLDNILFKYTFLSEHTLVSESREVNGLVRALDNEFCNGTASCRSLLEPMSAKAIDEIHVVKQRLSEDGVLIERALLIMAGP